MCSLICFQKNAGKKDPETTKDSSSSSDDDDAFKESAVTSDWVINKKGVFAGKERDD